MHKAFLANPNGNSVTFGEIDDLSARMAMGMAEHGVQPGDRVMVQTDKSAATVALYLAVLRIGAIFVPLNTAYTTAEVEYFLADASPKLFFCRSNGLNVLKEVADKVGVHKTLVLGTQPEEYFWKESLLLEPLAKIET